MTVALDQPATIDTRAQVLSGHVVHVEDEIARGTLTVVVEVAEQDPAGAIVGLSVDVRIETGHLEDVTFVDRPAITS